MKIIHNLKLDSERALYGIRDAEVRGCIFDGDADGESALKECADVYVHDCDFRLRYPLWHAKSFRICSSSMSETARAALWYCEGGKINKCTLNGIKALRECKNIALDEVCADSPEFGWKCDGVRMNGCKMISEYFMFESKNVDVAELEMSGKYSFQYVENMTMKNSRLDTKDAFWHSKNVTVYDSVLRGEYLGWYSDSLTLVRCKIIGTQPLCYCKNLTLVDCTTEGCDLCFEYSDVKATVQGHIVSVKNPRSGSITADSIGQIVTDGSVIDTDCEINITEG